MKIWKLIILGLFCVPSAVAQDTNRALPKNTIKWNVIPIVTRTISLEYERAFAKKFSLNAVVAYTPKGDLPFKSMLIDITDESAIINATRFGSFAMALEGRFYLSKKAAHSGFYLAPFLKYGTYSANTKVRYSDSTWDTGTIDVAGNINAFTAGIAVGIQWQLTKRIVLDWRIIGPSYGFSNGLLEGRRHLTADEQAYIREQLDKLNELPVLNIKNDINAVGVKTTVNGAWAGIRTGLSIGFRF